jgi:sugar transferase (PEP-CTERM system associated)
MKVFRAGKRGHGNPVAILVVVDFLAATFAFCLAMWLRFAFSGATLDWFIEATPYPASSFVFWVMVGMLAMGLYRVRQRPTTKEAVARVILAVVLGSLANILFFYMVPDFFVVGRGVMALAMLIACVMLAGIRLLMLRLIDDNPVKRRVLVVGAGDSASKISMLRRRSDRRRFEAVAYVALEGDRLRASELGIEPVIDADEVVNCRFDEIVVALDDRRGMLPMEFLLQFKQRGVPVTDLVDFLERETEYLDLDILRPSWLLYEKSSETSLIYRLLKRGFDVFFGVVLLVLTLPLTVLAVLAIVIEDGIGAPIFYRQTRVGRHGSIVRLYKFRSMRVDAERDTGPRWSTAGDDRITRTGRILRRFRIDELPQMLNIIKGDMSVVGPRPERPEFVEELSRQVPLYYYRHGVRPGLTGWAQLNFPYGASVADAREKLQYDLYYIKNASLILDLLILLQTAEVVVWGRGTSMSGAAPGNERRGKPPVPDQPSA